MSVSDAYNKLETAKNPNGVLHLGICTAHTRPLEDFHLSPEVEAVRRPPHCIRGHLRACRLKLLIETVTVWTLSLVRR